MNSKLFVIFALAVASLEAKPSLSKTELTPIGRVGEQKFFVNHEEISWAAAVQFCKSHNMKLATITNSAQVDYLDEELTKLNEFSRYWTAGRREVVWSTTGEAFDKVALGRIDYFAENECMAFRIPRAEYSSHWRTLPCTDIWPVICEE